MLSSEHLNLLVKGGYLTQLPIDPGQGEGTSDHYSTPDDGGYIRCRVHGAPATPAGAWVNAKDPLGAAFGREHAAMEDSASTTDLVALVGPVSAQALGLAEGRTEAHYDEVVEATNNPSPGIRRVAALALRRLRNPAGVPVLRHLLADPDEYVRKQAAWSLGYLGSAADHAALMPLLGDRAERVRDFAAMALARLKSPEGGAAALAVVGFTDRPPIRRGEAAIALADGKHTSAIPALKALLATGPDKDLVVRLEQAIQRLGAKI